MSLNKHYTWKFKGVGCISEFAKRFDDKTPKNYPFIAYNAKGYDGYFIVKQLWVEKMDVDFITPGGKQMCMAVKKLGIRCTV